MDSKDLNLLLVTYLLGIGGTTWSLVKLLSKEKILSESQYYKVVNILIGAGGFLVVGIFYSIFLFCFIGNSFLTKNRAWFIVTILIAIFMIINGGHAIKFKNKINDKIMYRTSVNIFWGGVVTLLICIGLFLCWGGVPAAPWVN
jgi:hypothetical protein